jgi:hypothetical protein
MKDSSREEKSNANGVVSTGWLAYFVSYLLKDYPIDAEKTLSGLFLHCLGLLRPRQTTLLTKIVRILVLSAWLSLCPLAIGFLVFWGLK